VYPVLFELGSITIYTYGVLVAAGFLFALFYARRQAPRAGLDPHKIWNLGIYGILVALLVSKLWLVLSAWDFFIANPSIIFSVVTFQSGGTFYGGILGGIVWVVLYCYFKNMPFLGVLDLLAPAVALGHGIGRLGCFAAGCCYGKPTSLPWGVKFSSPVAEQIAGTPLHASLHPTQLYEAGAEFINFALLVWLGAGFRQGTALAVPKSAEKSGASAPEVTGIAGRTAYETGSSGRPQRGPHGKMIGAYFILYGVERGAIEIFRGDPGRTLMFHDTVSLMQLVSVGLILAGAFLWWRVLRASAQPQVL
jgi:phosphatidylglycerol:prolipoprotein diacylglycerol transferase